MKIQKMQNILYSLKNEWSYKLLSASKDDLSKPSKSRRKNNSSDSNSSDYDDSNNNDRIVVEYDRTEYDYVTPCSSRQTDRQTVRQRKYGVAEKSIKERHEMKEKLRDMILFENMTTLKLV